MCQQFVTPHCHPLSLDTGSSVESFIKREKELGSGAVTVTDHGSLGACRQIYKLARKEGLTPILGLEGYLRDDDCRILTEAGIEKDEKGTFSSYSRYYHITMHAQDQEAYETIVRNLSDADLRGETHGSERKALFTWAQLEEIGSKNTTFMSSCLAGVVQRHLLADRPDLAIKYYEKIRSCARPGNFYVEVFPHACEKFWVKGIFFTVAGEADKRKYWFDKHVRLEINGKIVEGTAEEHAKSFARAKTPPKVRLLAVMHYRKWQEEEPKEVLNIELVEDFLPNECRPWSPDGAVQIGANQFVLYLAQKYGDKVLVSDDSHFATPEYAIVQDIRLRAGGDSWRMSESYHRKSSEEAFNFFRDRMGVSKATFEGWVENSREWASRFKDFKFKDRKALPTGFYPKDTLAHTLQLIKKHGRMRWNNPVYVDRLETEIRMLHENGVMDFLAYFFPDEEICSVYRENGLYTGIGRGSAASLYLAYLLGITHVDPIKYDLPYERFMTPDRIKNGKYPDIDQDLGNREFLLDPENGWLFKRFGHEYVCGISTDQQSRLKMSIKDVARVLRGHVPPEIEKLAGAMPVPPQGISDRKFIFGYEDETAGVVKGIIETDASLKEYVEKYPEDWKIVQDVIGLVRAKGRHACGYVISDEPIKNFIPITTVGGIRCTQYTAPWVEEAGGIKMDFLGLNSLLDIQEAVRLVQQANGYTPKDEMIDGIKVPGIYVLPHQGNLYNLWDLPEDINVFTDICKGDVETVFQFDGDSAQQWLPEFWDGKKPYLTSILALSAFTALDRPGPLDAFVEEAGTKRNMLQEYAARARGEKPIGNMPLLDEMLPDTYGVIVYQEQLQKIFQKVGGTDGIQADNFRIHIGKKKMEEVMADRAIFMPGAVAKLGQEEAERLWGMMFTFGQYGFNRSHSLCYAMTGYVCAFLKHYYPLQWWASVLGNAQRNEINNVFWGHCGHLIDLPDMKLSGEKFEIQNGRIRAPLSLLNGIGTEAHKELLAGRPYTDLRSFVTAIWQGRLARGEIVKKEIKPKKLTKKQIAAGVPEPQPTTVEVLKPGRSALNRTILSKLIVSGTMDSFFPPEASLYEKMMTFAELKAEVEGKKRPEKVDATYTSVTPLQRYILRKEILPAYAEDLNPLIAAVRVDFKKELSSGKYYFITEREFQDTNKIPVVTGKDLNNLENDRDYLPAPIMVAVPCYIMNVKRFWNNKAVKIQIDTGDTRRELVKWPGRNGKPVEVPENLASSVAILTLAKFSAGKPFRIEDIYVVQEKFSPTTEESPE